MTTDSNGLVNKEVSSAPHRHLVAGLPEHSSKDFEVAESYNRDDELVRSLERRPMVSNGEYAESSGWPEAVNTQPGGLE